MGKPAGKECYTLVGNNCMYEPAFEKQNDKYRYSNLYEPTSKVSLGAIFCDKSLKTMNDSRSST
jgi:hypothetical protein